jgi:hypothetical protein
MSLALLSLLAAVITACGSVSPPVVNSRLVFYTDAPGVDWEDWSWDCWRNFRSSAPVHAGKYAIAVDYAEKGWGGLAFGRHDAVSTKGYDRLEFWVHGGASGGQLLRVSFNTCVGNCELPPGGLGINDPKYLEGGVVSPNTWKLVSIPLADLGAVDVSIVKLNIMDNSGSTQPTFYVDDIVLAKK